MLNLTKIELKGFKSFADKVVIPFKEGVTAIIGPNGCGKSNVSDAIRWTIGEQSPTKLRGKKMKDVIFSGTETRGSMSFCEVSLYFDNTGRRVFKNLDYDEVVVTRKLDKAGFSEYLINGTPVKREAFLTLFRDTGIGKDGYSLIGQGRVDDILSAKPEERRHIFEEAAGISQFRVQRTRSFTDLSRAEANLQTVNEVISEIEKQIGPLRKQAEVALKYAELRDDLRNKEVNLYIYNYENNQNIKEEIRSKIRAYAAELDKQQEILDEATVKYEDCFNQIQNIDSDYSSSSRELTDLKVSLTRFEGEANVQKEKLNNIRSEIDRLDRELSSVDSQLIASSKLIADAEERKQSAMNEYVAMTAEYTATQTKYDAIVKEVEGSESNLENSNLQYVHSMEELERLRNNFGNILAEKSLQEERQKNLSANIATNQAALNEGMTNLAIYRGNVTTAKERAHELEEKYNETVSRRNDCVAAIKGYDDDIIKLNAALGQAKGAYELSVRVKEDLAFYPETVRRLMQDAKNNPTLSSKIMGVIGEVLDVPKEFSAAIEYALGNAQYNVIVPNSKAAEELILYLKQKNYGRCTFRPITNGRPQRLLPEVRGILKEAGCLGIASEIISFDRKYAPVIETLLGDTVVVNNISVARLLFEKYSQKVKIVTLDGDYLSPNGAFTGGSKRSGNGLFAQEKQIETAKVNLEKIKKNIETLDKYRTEAREDLAECDKIIAEITEEVNELKITLSLNSDKAKQTAELTETLKKQIDDDTAELANVNSALSELNLQISEIEKLEKMMKERKDEYNELLASSKSVGAKQKSERQIVSEQLSELRLKHATLKNTIDTISGEITRLNKEKADLEQEKLDLTAAIRRSNDQLNSLIAVPMQENVTEDQKTRVEFLEKKLIDLSDRKRMLNEQLKALDEQKTETSKLVNDLIQKKTYQQGQLENVDIEIRNMEQHIREDYDLDYNSALVYKQEDYNPYGAKTAIADLKKAISKLGDVNPLAPETLKETEERLQKQIVARDDVVQACLDIRKVIDDLTAKMRDNFMTAFNAINDNFAVVFGQLFEGGRGELRLNEEDSDDPLEQGIEIYVQPPGKRVQHISQLSGGERALTAIGILFSILKLKPMPFCVLDEIEAALDDTNVSLFASFLKRFSDYTQFVVITHRKGTMALADTIFGVTMEEKGVSKIVSVELQDAIKQATEN